MARFLGMQKIAWSLRRVHCPVDAKALVLEIGAGGNPYFRSNVLVDAYESTGERHWVPLTMDRPTVLAFAETLPFKDKEFDFVIASHVLEHSLDPVRFLGEMQRVSKAGYIEVPDAFMERINPYPDHRLEITVRNGKLVIRKKKAWQVDPELVELYEDRVKQIVTGHVIPSHPFDFHVRYYWADKIDYVIVNPEVEIFMGEAEQPNTRLIQTASMRSKVQAQLLKTIRNLFSQHARNSQIDLIKLLQCTNCQHGELAKRDETLVCQGCGKKYLIRNGMPDMTNAIEALS
jgi:SAM-dependent methyltransferase